MDVLNVFYFILGSYLIYTVWREGYGETECDSGAEA